MDVSDLVRVGVGAVSVGRTACIQREDRYAGAHQQVAPVGPRRSNAPGLTDLALQRHRPRLPRWTIRRGLTESLIASDTLRRLHLVMSGRVATSAREITSTSPSTGPTPLEWKVLRGPYDPGPPGPALQRRLGHRLL